MLVTVMQLRLVVAVICSVILNVFFKTGLVIRQIFVSKLLEEHVYLISCMCLGLYQLAFHK